MNNLGYLEYRNNKGQIICVAFDNSHHGEVMALIRKIRRKNKSDALKSKHTKEMIESE